MSNNDKLLNFIILIEEKNLFKNKSFFYFICDLNNFILFSLVLKFEN